MSFSADPPALIVGAFVTPPGWRNKGGFIWARITFLGEEQRLSHQKVGFQLPLFAFALRGHFDHEPEVPGPAPVPKQRQGSQQVAVGARTHDGCSHFILIPAPAQILK